MEDEKVLIEVNQESLSDFLDEALDNLEIYRPMVKSILEEFFGITYTLLSKEMTINLIEDEFMKIDYKP